MALFQPTNIFPDLKGGMKNGVVFFVANGTVDVSWTVNGNSPLYAYQIDFYKNDTNSTYTGTTGKITLGTPFSAIDAEGNERRFTATVALSKFASSYDSTNYEGKIKITQWWSSNAGDNVVQRSLSVFRMAAHGSLSVSTPTGCGGLYSIAGTPLLSSVFGPMTLNWTRWQLFHNDDNDLVQDTGKVWGATDYRWYPNYIAPGDDYFIRFSAETSAGEEIYVDSIDFDVMHDAVEVSGNLKVFCDQTAQAVRISYEAGPTDWIPGTFSGTHSIDYENTVLAPGAEAFWTIPASVADAPWSFIWKGKIDTSNISGSQPFFEICQSDGTAIVFGYDSQAQGFYTQPAFSGLNNVQVQNGDEYMVVFTMGATAGTKNVFSWYVLHLSSGTILGSASGVVSSYTQARAARVFIYQGTTEYWQLLYGTYNADIITSGTTGADCQYNGPSVSYFGLPYQSGSASVGAIGSDTNEIAIFRQDSTGIITPVIYQYLPTVPSGSYALDYTALNGQTYQYVIYYQDSEDDQPTIIKSAAVTPCFWSWALIEATEDIKNTFYAENVFLFRNNVSTGNLGNGNSRNVYSTFTKYPVVMQNTQNRKAGTLGGLIGSVTNGEYNDTNATMNAIFALSTSKNALFLRNRRGEIYRIALTGEISMNTEDNSPKQQLTASVPWVEVGPTDNVSVVEFVSGS